MPQKPSATNGGALHDAMRSFTDEELYARCARSDAHAEAAFAELYARHSPRIYGYCRCVFRDRAQADDVFQETFTRLLESARKGVGVEHVAAYILIIARNQCLNAKRLARPTVTLEDARLMHEEDPEDRREMVDLITAAVGLLDDEYREPFYLREFEDLPYEEIAGLLDTTPGNVRVRVSRARQKIRELLKPYLQEYAAHADGPER